MASLIAGNCQTLAQKSTISNEEVRKRRSKLFTKEKQKQIDLVTRVEKIEVNYKGIPEDTKFLLNKGLSTPYNIAQRKFLPAEPRSATG